MSYDASIKRCPKLALTDEVNDLLGVFYDWRDLQLLPYPGDIGDQPAYIVEALRACLQATIEANEQWQRQQTSTESP